jgi:RimJ/RimL family protein N-acetyltransferase
MIVAETERLLVRWFEPDDAGFILELVNEPSWIRFIGDKNVRDVEGARAYLERGPIDSYRKRGFGLNLVALRASGAPIGMCGLIKRDTLPDVDVGFAFLPAYWGRGYAQESAAAVLDHGRRALGVTRVVAILSPDNESSAKLLERLGFRRDGMIRMPPDDEELLHYVSDGPGGPPR